MSIGKERDLKWMQARLQDKYEIKTKWLGPREHQEREVMVLNRIFTWEQDGIGYEADPRHVEVMIGEFGFKDCASVGTPGTSIDGKTKENFMSRLEPTDETRYRALVARANYLAPDRADTVFSVKGLANSIAKPTECDWTRLKRFGRYLSERPRMQVMFRWQNIQELVYMLH